MDASDFSGVDDTLGGSSAASPLPTSEDEARLIELVGFLVQGIVSHPEDVEVEEFFDEVGIVYGVRVHPDDVGRVIGREGRVAGALRHLAKAAATKVGTHVTVEVLTEDGPELRADPPFSA